jgi:hypothetical protein
MSACCPHCNEAIKSKDILFKSVITCDSCNKESCFGNFLQWLSVSSIALFSLFALLAALSELDKMDRLMAVAAGVVFVFAIAHHFIIRPVPNVRSRWIMRLMEKCAKKRIAP